MLRNLGRKSTSALFALFNTLWIQEAVPVSWKTARLHEILKPCETPLSLDYLRPLSLTSCLCKVMEKMIAGKECQYSY